MRKLSLSDLEEFQILSGGRTGMVSRTGWLLLCSIIVALVWAPTSYAQSDELTPIYAIQGSGTASPFIKKRVDTFGVVTAVTNNGFYLQDPFGDGDLATSDGVFVYTRTAPNQTAGSCVTISGAFVDEYFEKTELTELRGRSVQPSDRCGTTEIEPVQVPFARLAVDPQTIFEQYEGMLVALDRIEGIVQGPTKRFRGGDAEIAFVTPAVAENLVAGRIFQWQAAQMSALMYLSTPNSITFPELAWGDQLLVDAETGGDTPVVAVLDYNFGKYQLILQPGSQVSPHPESSQQKRAIDDPASPTASDEITVCTFNVLGLGKGRDQFPAPDVYMVELEKRALAIAQSLNGCTIIGLQETGQPEDVENLADFLRLNYELDYEPVSVAGPMTRNPEFPLTNSFLVRRARAKVMEVELRQACTQLSYDVRYQPGACERGTFGLFSRPPLVLDIQIGTEADSELELTVINNHWKSKGGDEEVNVVRRKAQALHVAGLVQEKLTQNPSANVIVLGDLNDYYQSGPVEAMINATEPPLVHTYDFLRPLDRYTYSFNGASQVLDHILVTPNLVSMIAGVDPVHINADYPYPIETEVQNVYHSSDHDPIVLKLSANAKGWISANVGYGGVQVTLLDSSGAIVAEAVSDDLGDVRLWDIEPETYTLALTLPNHLIAADAVDNSKSSIVSVEPGLNEIQLLPLSHKSVNLGLTTLLLMPDFGDIVTSASQ